MSFTVWYVSKYVAIPRAKRGGTRGFMLLREMAKRGARSVMITSDSNHLTQVPEIEGSHFIECIDDVTICWLKVHKYRGARSIGRMLSWLHFEWRLWRLAKKELGRPDAIIVSSLSLLTVLSGIYLSRQYRAKLIFEVRDIWPLTIIEEADFSPRNPFVYCLSLIERMGYREADAIVGTMPNLGQHVREQTGRTKDVYTVPFGIDREMVENVEALPPSWADKYIPTDKFVLCYAGTIGTTNALETLFETAELLRSEPIHFLIVGDGDLKDEFEARYRYLENVTFTGPVPKPMVQSVAAVCQATYFSAFPSKVWEYGMSLNKVMEYMLAARPVIGSYTGYRTMIEEAECGTIAPAGDPQALAKVLRDYMGKDPAELDAIGANGRRWLFANRSYSRLAEEYLVIAGAREDDNDPAGGANRPSEILEGTL